MYARYRLVLISVLCAGVIGGCRSDEGLYVFTNESTKPDTTAGSWVYVVMGHEVEDYQQWMAAHSMLNGIEESWGLTDQEVMQGVDADSIVWIIMRAPDLESAQGFLEDPETATMLEIEGVRGEIYRAVLAPGYRNSFQPEQFSKRIIVQHPVRDFEAWKRIFDAHVVSRERAGLVDLLVTYPVGDTLDVHMMFGVVDEAALIEYMASSSLPAAMRHAGVIGQPNAYIVRKTD